MCVCSLAQEYDNNKNSWISLLSVFTVFDKTKTADFLSSEELLLYLHHKIQLQAAGGLDEFEFVYFCQKGHHLFSGKVLSF